MSTGKLLLHLPGDNLPQDIAALEKGLREIGLIGESLNRAEHIFQAGERFLHLVTFLGCSPYVRFEPEDDQDEDFCYIKLSGPHNRVQFRRGSNTQRPGCPGCRRKISDTDEMIENWLTTGKSCTCPHCGAHFDAPELRWRQSAGFGRFFIEVNSVFPCEAIPSQELLNHLKGDGEAWEFFYIQ
ncbi:hypothetical protein [Solemya velesiana gill symbiont]|uniref:Uncharacterized protein n=1 Tax=Solemya velesiana gill symbiont TaxID=1918948 RepID=A0A1T2KTF6_9GAMM|nr:hypothetical protein [Solemya velesiana gill symbiont]OOZ36148.1 hypothetical protein BOW51_08620 [Solemya velesiana gill symbiont]